jgi:hypothetical protein
MFLSLGLWTRRDRGDGDDSVADLGSVCGLTDPDTSALCAFISFFFSLMWKLASITFYMDMNYIYLSDGFITPSQLSDEAGDGDDLGDDIKNNCRYTLGWKKGKGCII